MELSHLNDRGEARMVDVGGKTDTERLAIARGEVRMKPETLHLITRGKAAKGDVLGVARVAGIMAAKKTSGLIPLCHPIGISSVEVDLSPVEEASSLEIEARVRCTGKTGVEMEALVGVSVAALTVYDMVKAVDKDIVIGDIRLIEKSGGRSGHYIRGEASGDASGGSGGNRDN